MNKYIENIFQEVLYLTCWPKRKVYVRARRPYPPDASGCVYVNRHGIIVMDIDPTLDMQAAYETFLHELGHVYYGHTDNLAKNNWMDRTPGTGPNELTTPAQVDAHRHTPDELAADIFVKKADDRITAKRNQLFKPGTTTPQIYQKYFILQHYPLEVLS